MDRRARRNAQNAGPPPGVFYWAGHPHRGAARDLRRWAARAAPLDSVDARRPRDLRLPRSGNRRNAGARAGRGSPGRVRAGPAGDDFDLPLGRRHRAGQRGAAARQDVGRPGRVPGRNAQGAPPVRASRDNGGPCCRRARRVPRLGARRNPAGRNPRESRMTRRFTAAACRWLLLALALIAPAAHAAVSEADLLPVDEAYKLTAVAPTRNRVEFTWAIAEGYYLYKHRFGVQPMDSSFKFNPLELPAGKKHTDEFFGEVETYRGSVTAVLTGATASNVDEVTFKVKFQGCADVGVCYPPTTRTVTVAMPREGAASGTDPVADPLAALGADRSGNLLAPDEALPAEQAFRVEAIAASPASLLLRLTPAPGYYIYRDKTAVRVVDAPGFATGKPAWPPGRDYHDEHFGDVVVYFDQV